MTNKLKKKPYKKRKSTIVEPNGILPEGGIKSLFAGETLHFIIGVTLLIIAAFMLVSFVSHFLTGFEDQSAIEAQTIIEAHNYMGKFGALTATYFIDQSFGVTAFFIPLFIFLLSMRFIGAYRVRLWKWFLNFSILMIWGSVAFSIAERHFLSDNLTSVAFKWGGAHGDFISNNLEHFVGLIGTLIILGALAILYLAYLTDETIVIVRKLLNPKAYIIRSGEKEKNKETEEIEKISLINETDKSMEIDQCKVAINDPNQENESMQNSIDGEANVINLNITPVEIPTTNKESVPSNELEFTPTVQEEKATVSTVGETTDLAPYDPRKDLLNYRFPPLSLLKHYDNLGPEIDMVEQKANQDRIVNVLKTFGVDISGIKATIGPTITLYEVTPAPGVRINKIKNLSDDLALNLAATGVRIIAPIPGKGTIGIEVPNQNPRIVSMESILNSKRFQESKFELPIALGKTITNEVFMVDLAKLPHLLVAGATGQGKSVGLNAIITSLLYKKHPAELKIVMIDPKKVEFSVYTPIERHFLAKVNEDEEPIITDVSKVVETLKSICVLMDHRYDLLKLARVRNIKEYNEKFKERKLNPEKGHEFMPYIVVIIDEFGDLIMTAGKEVELPIARIAQLARAVGIHMVIATQRPTTNIITGTIKANFPARMAFKVSSMIDSRTILDRPGANQLVGRGDMLFLAGNEPVRVQCAFVDTPEVEQINEFICNQQGYLAAFELPEVSSEESIGGNIGSMDSGPLDVMFDEVARYVVNNQDGSTSRIQRIYSIGYNRAGRIMDQLEQHGIIGPIRGSKPREVIVPDEVALNAILEIIHQR